MKEHLLLINDMYPLTFLASGSQFHWVPGTYGGLHASKIGTKPIKHQPLSD